MRHLDVCDSDFGYPADDLRAEGSVELVQHVRARCGIESDQDVTWANASRRITRRERLHAGHGAGPSLCRSGSEDKGKNDGHDSASFNPLELDCLVGYRLFKHRLRASAAQNFSFASRLCCTSA